MSSPIDKKTLEHLAKLARVELNPNEEEKLIKDLAGILGHFAELQTLDTSRVAPLTGGSELTNVFREDTERENTDQKAGSEQFPETREGFLKVPPVFSADLPAEALLGLRSHFGEGGAKEGGGSAPSGE